MPSCVSSTPNKKFTSSGSPGRGRTGIPLYPATLGLDRFKIRDNQGHRLTRFRQHCHSIAKKQSGISRRMQALLQKAQEEGWADKDSNIAIRDGRMVIPVPAAFKRN